MSRRIRLGMVGGGEGSFIGAAHRVAARLDDGYELVAAALSSDPSRALTSGAKLHLAPERCYASYAEMPRRSGRVPTVLMWLPSLRPIICMCLWLGPLSSKASTSSAISR